MVSLSGKERPRAGDVKAVAVDIDGTLADDSRRLDLGTVSALREVQDSGVDIMLASGNVLPITYALQQYLGFKGPLIAENGGMVCHGQKVWVLGDSKRPHEAYEYLSSKMSAPRLFTDKWRETEVGMKREVDLEHVRKILESWDVDVQTTGWAIHIMQKGMNKYLGVQKGCELLNISVDQVAAIGDSDNDEMMIRECGWGIAVGNAFEGTKKAASFVARKDHGAGVLEGLEWLGLIRR
ncbi:MAG: phosphoglycolate phosphatase [Euryarchaeota archaeon RBG_13_57_23]|nr:MAG: phosphoglycolate phosphatase [Euryarchaeota archaeon RBG_13_57_23]